MSARYVWEQCTIASKQVWSVEKTQYSSFPFRTITGKTKAFAAQGLNKGEYWANVNTNNMWEDDGLKPGSSVGQEYYPMVVFANDESDARYGTLLYWIDTVENPVANATSKWRVSNTGTNLSLSKLASGVDAIQFTVSHGVQTQTQDKGTFLGNKSGATNNLYPTNGASGGYWYVYSGSDSIDPVSISTPVNKWLYIGQQLTIIASPSTSIKYGGTISYQYQVQLNGGSWTNIGSKTTATSINYNIPEGTTSIRFQVLASDNMGFTSTTWVQSPTYQVSKYVPGIAQKLHRKNASGEYDLIHMETDTQIVLMNSGSTLEDELLAILAEIERRGG